MPKAQQSLTNLKDYYEEMDFRAECSGNLPGLLKQLNISLAFTSYQASRLMLVRSDGAELDISYKSFPRPMGLAADTNSLTLGTFTQVLRFSREDALLTQIKQSLAPIEDDITAPRMKTRPEQEQDNNAAPDEQAQQEAEWQAYQAKLFEPVDERTDACFITRASHYTGMINIHDIAWGTDGLWAVNSSFSCLCTLEPDFSFVPRWQPHFITELVPEDRCHLNGMALKDGVPAYVTTFSQFNELAKWRDNKDHCGTLMDVASNEVLVEGLAMPHSPRWYNGKVYFCNSGFGELCTYNPTTGDVEVIARLPGFTRGMDFYGPLLFLGLSKVRQSEQTKSSPLSDMYEQTYSGIWVLNLDDNSLVASLSFTGNVDQIYDIAVLPDCSFPELIEPQHPRMRNHFCLPGQPERESL
ncbi:TIGR03032 family protein [Bowmanella sp. Y26]|uniref:TIGR03032 family protein n=1 Tax=Bowmanella yangjiangensis TaxID=2811230 RepID=UPI001BDD5F0F|nr:TIGR03032 family protein [Bowmanella yangjiangensis]MBT1062796.1 TIGR03032 family protein [Bowmanella yangjiangensis]